MDAQVTQFEQVKKSLMDRPKTWMVSGAAGFIGSNLTEFLLQMEQAVVGLDNFSTGHATNLDDIRKSVSEEQWSRFKFVEGDIQEYDTCHFCLKDVDNVLHHAAMASVPQSVADPHSFSQVNINGTLNMMLAANDHGIENFVYASTSAVYGDDPADEKVENVIGNPLSPYAVTKYANELFAYTCSENYGFKPVGLRYFNIFGKRQDPNGAYAAVIPKWISALATGEDVKIFGDGETTRDFCYIENVVQANILAAECMPESKGQVYNIAVGTRTSLNQLLDVLVQALGEQGIHCGRSPEYLDFRPGDVQHSLANIDKAVDQLGYRPTHTLKDGLKNAIAWYCECLLENS